MKIDSETLPKGFEPPNRPLAIMNLELPLVTKEELEKLRKEWQKFSKTKADCDTGPTGRKVVEASVRYRLASMTVLKPSDLRDNPKAILQIRQELIREISQYGGPAKRKEDIASMADVVYKEVLKQIPEYLKNNFYVRLNAVLILSEMDYKLAYVPSYELLLQVIQAKDIRDDEVNGQPEAIKVDAVKGLIRILRFSFCPIKDRTVIANAMVTELAKKDVHWWRQERMIEVLRYCGITGVDAGNNNKPFVVECLTSIVKDKERDYRVRARACYALGRVPLPSSIKPDDVVTDIADFALKLANAAAADPDKQSIWKACFWDVYLAFHTNHRPKEREQDLDAEEKRDGGLLVIIKSAALPAYELIVPIVSDVLNGKSPDAGSVKKLNDFVRPRQPLVANPKE